MAASQPAKETVATVAVREEPQQVVAAALSSPALIDLTSEREEIARLAYLYWESRGGQGGSAEEDWLRAEQEFQKRRVNTAA